MFVSVKGYSRHFQSLSTSNLWGRDKEFMMQRPEMIWAAEGKPKILFVAHARSSHTQSWIELVSGTSFDVRIFGVRGTIAPPNFPFRVYSTGNSRKPGWVENYLKWRADMVCHKIGNDAFRVKMLDGFSRAFGHPEFWFQHFEEEWLAQIIKCWQPDVIHTLGLDPSAYFYIRVRKRFGLEGIGRWVVTARGGSDVALARLDPVWRDNIRQVLVEADHFIADNDQTYQVAMELGLEAGKIIPRGRTPGGGGVEVDRLRSLRKTPPSASRIIVFPKAYESPFSKALPVFEALNLCWERVSPCTIHLMAHDEEALQWFRALPEKIRLHCKLEERIPRDILLSAMANSRIVLAPSLIDGIPNTLYEAMATGAFPIFSPLESFSGLVRHGENILFARNLYPGEIAEALVRGMNDDELVDSAATKNLSLVRDIADRSVIAQDVLKFYRSILIRR